MVVVLVAGLVIALVLVILDVLVVVEELVVAIVIILVDVAVILLAVDLVTTHVQHIVEMDVRVVKGLVMTLVQVSAEDNVIIYVKIIAGGPVLIVVEYPVGKDVKHNV